MTIALRFLGAADTVTGSCFVLETPGGNVMVDCGMFQGPRELRERNRTFEGLDPSSIDAVIITHAHLDHCGRLPRLVRLGWQGPVFATDATRDLARIVMLDSAGIHEETARRAARRRDAGKRYDDEDLEPLYDTGDALDAAETFRHGLGYDQRLEIIPGMHATFRDAGHILGSSFVELEIAREGAEPFRLTFSGDLGNLAKPIVRDPSEPNAAHAVVMETTYCDRDHRDFAASVAELRGIVEQIVADRGVLLIPSFALERTQELLVVLNGFYRDGLLERVPVYVDSPMATDATRVFARHPECHDRELTSLMDNGDNPFRWGMLRYTRATEDSKALNHVQGPMIIVAPSGMCSGGRIMHHLRNRLMKPETTVAFMGYQAEGTLGRRIIEGADFVRIYGREVAVRAQTATINGFSAHAGRSTLVSWYGKTGPAPHLMLVHGEEDRLRRFQREMRGLFETKVDNPAHGGRIVLSP